MAITNMHVSYVDSTITVKIPTADAPTTGLPFSISLSTTPAVAMDLTNSVTLTSQGLDNIYTIYVYPAQSYMVRAGAINSGTYAPMTMDMKQGESYELQPTPATGVLIFKNLDSVAPTLEPFSTLVPIAPVSEFNSSSALPAVIPSALGNPQTPPANTTYFVAKFSEGVSGVSNTSFNVTQNFASTQPSTVQPLWLTGGAWTNVAPHMSSSLASHYLVTVNAPLNPDTSQVVVSLKSAPPAIVSVQEMNAMPLGSQTNSGFSVGVQPGSMMSPGNTVSWLKVTLGDSAEQFLREARDVPGSLPRLEFTYAFGLGYATPTTSVNPSYAVLGTDPKVVYLGFNSVQQGPTEAPISIAFKASNSSPITDRAGNILGSIASGPAPRYLDAAGEPAFSPIWEGNTTTITDTSVNGYANGKVVFAIDGTKTYSALDPLLPSYFTDGKPLQSLPNGDPKYETNGLRTGMETIDLSDITGGPIVISAESGEAFVYRGIDPLVFDVSYYDRYILNDSAGNAFHGTVDSEYVVVGSGGGNFLDAGNKDPSDILSTVTVKNYQFNRTGVERETDIVDYSQLVNGQLGVGITVDLGALGPDAEVTVDYKNSTKEDRIIGFEGVVGSIGDDTISGSDVGNFLAGGAGADELRGYTGAVDKLYSPAVADYGTKGNSNFKEAQFLVDSSDILYGGAGADKLYGGAGRDMLIDLDNAQMWGSDTGRIGDATVNLRSTDKSLAENDVFLVRGDGAEKATINNFHLSKDGIGLAGRSNSANDAIIFSVDSSKLGVAYNFADPESYNQFYKRLTFDKIKTTAAADTTNDDIDLVVKYRNDDGSFTKVGSTTIADMGSMVNGSNRAEVVQLKWLSEPLNNPYHFNPKIDLDLTAFASGNYVDSSSINIAVALELLQAGTVRGANAYGVMAAKLSDVSDVTLEKRVYNPGDKDDRILGTAKNDSYEYVVQNFTEPSNSGIAIAPPAAITNQVGNDKIFDTGGDKDVMMFETARIEDLVFSAVKVGRESKLNSLKVQHRQTEMLDGDTSVTNQGEVVWQGHYKEGGRQALEVLKIGNKEYDMAQAVYEYNAKGYAKAGPKITADNARDVIMVGQGVADKFVFDFDPTVERVGGSTTQSARIAGFDSADKIDISDYVKEYGAATTSVNAGKAVITFKDPAASTVTNFTLELTFQESVVFDPLQQLLLT